MEEITNSRAFNNAATPGACQGDLLPYRPIPEVTLTPSNFRALHLPAIEDLANAHKGEGRARRLALRVSRRSGYCLLDSDLNRSISLQLPAASKLSDRLDLVATLGGRRGGL